MKDWTTLAGRVDWAMRRINISQAALASAVGINRQAITPILNGKTKTLKGGNLLKMASVLGVNPEWLQSGKGQPLSELIANSSEKKHIPVLSFETADQWEQRHKNAYDPAITMKTTTISEDFGQYAFALIVADNSMSPDYLKWDEIVIDPQAPLAPGKLVIAKLDDDPASVFRKYKPRGNDKNGKPIIELAPLNPDWPTITIDAKNPGKIIGVVVKFSRNL